MRWMMRSLLSWIVLTIVPLGALAQTREQTVSGKLMLPAGNMNCSTIIVELELTELQPIDVTYTDASCTFRFNKVAPGSYMIHVNVDGFEELHHTIEVNFGGVMGSTLLQLVPSPGRLVRGPRDTSQGGTADVTELMGQYPRKAVSLYEKAIENKKKGKNSQAIEQLEQAIKIAPNFFHAHNSLGVLYKLTGRLEDAETEFVRAHQINRYSPEPLINLSGLYLEEDQPERAMKVSEEAVQTNSRSAPALFNLGISLYKLAKLDKAEAALKKALEIAPKMFQIHLALANVYLKLRRFDNLLDHLNTYLEENPNGLERPQVERLRDQVLKARGGAGL